jgi:hypothetical protein
MRRLCALALLVLALWLSGCVSGPQPYLDAPQKTVQEKQTDGVECQALAAQAATGAGSWSRDRAVRSAFYDNAREQYLAQCLQGRGWAWQSAPSAPIELTIRPAAAVRPADYDRMRYCQQEVLWFLRYYGGPRDGGDNPVWQRIWHVYLAEHGLAIEPAPTQAQIQLVIDRDLAARHQSLNWEACL